MKHTFNYKPSKVKKPQGLGDTVENITKATGIKSFLELGMKTIGKKDCGCKKRKEWLNKKFPYNNKK
tara:strand:- start:7176 stop:7376 length:201 start_codon:yes stop_codon:yes gene_type:complete